MPNPGKPYEEAPPTMPGLRLGRTIAKNTIEHFASCECGWTGGGWEFEYLALLDAKSHRLQEHS